MPPKSPYGGLKAASWKKRGGNKLRELISQAERELLQKVVDDERYNLGKDKIFQQLEKSINPDLDTDENKDAEEDADDKPAPGPLMPHETVPVQKTPTDIFHDWANYCIRLCLEVWDVEKNVWKLSSLKKEAVKLEKNQTDAHKSYMQELSMLRNRIYRLEKKGTVEFELTKDDLIFYEPMQYLSDAGREMVKDIIIYKMKDELSKQSEVSVGGGELPSPSKNTELLDKIKEKERKIKELEEKLGDVQYEVKLLEDGQRAKDNAALEAAHGGGHAGDSVSQEGGSASRRASNKMSSGKGNASRVGGGKGSTASSRPAAGAAAGRAAAAQQIQEEGLAFEWSDEEDSARQGGGAPGEQGQRTGGQNDAASPGGANVTPEVKRKMTVLKSQIAEAKGLEREIKEELEHFAQPGGKTGSSAGPAGNKSGSRDPEASGAGASAGGAGQGAAAGKPAKLSNEDKKRQRELEQQLKMANMRIMELEGELKRDYRNFDTGADLADCGVGPGPGFPGAFAPGAFAAAGSFAPGMNAAAAGFGPGGGAGGGFGPGGGGGFGPQGGGGFGPGGGHQGGGGFGPQGSAGASFGPGGGAGGNFSGQGGPGGGFGPQGGPGGGSAQGGPGGGFGPQGGPGGGFGPQGGPGGGFGHQGGPGGGFGHQGGPGGGFGHQGGPGGGFGHQGGPGGGFGHQAGPGGGFGPQGGPGGGFGHQGGPGGGFGHQGGPGGGYGPPGGPGGSGGPGGGFGPQGGPGGGFGPQGGMGGGFGHQGGPGGGFGPGGGAGGSFGPGGAGDATGGGYNGQAGGGYSGGGYSGGGYSNGGYSGGGYSGEVDYDAGAGFAGHGGPAFAGGEGPGYAGPGGPAGPGRGGNKGRRAGGKKNRASINAGGAAGPGEVFAEEDYDYEEYGDEGDYDTSAPFNASDPSSPGQPVGRAPRAKRRPGPPGAAGSGSAAAAGSGPGSAHAHAVDAYGDDYYYDEDDYDAAHYDATSASVSGPGAPGAVGSSGSRPQRGEQGGPRGPRGPRPQRGEHGPSDAAGRPRPESPGGPGDYLSALAEEAGRAEHDLDDEPYEPTQYRGQQPHKGQKGGAAGSPAPGRPSRSRTARFGNESGEHVNDMHGEMDGEGDWDEMGHSPNLEHALEEHIEKKRASAHRPGPDGKPGLMRQLSEASDELGEIGAEQDPVTAVTAITQNHRAVQQEMKATKEILGDVHDDIQIVQQFSTSSDPAVASQAGTIAAKMRGKVAKMEQQLDRTAKLQAKMHRKSVAGIAAVAGDEVREEIAEAAFAEPGSAAVHSGGMNSSGKRSSLAGSSGRKKGGGVQLQGIGNSTKAPGDSDSDDAVEIGRGGGRAGGRRSGARAGGRASIDADASSEGASPALREKIDALKEKNTELEISVQEMQQKLKDMRKALKEAGMEKKADDIFERTGLNAVLKAKPKLPVFTRLYNDAIDRVKKGKEIKQLTKTQHAEALLSTLKKIYKPGNDESMQVTQLLPPAEPLSPKSPTSPKGSSPFFPSNEVLITPEMLNSLKCCTCGGYKLPSSQQLAGWPMAAEQGNSTATGSTLPEQLKQPPATNPSQSLRSTGRQPPSLQQPPTSNSKAMPVTFSSSTSQLPPAPSLAQSLRSTASATQPNTASAIAASAIAAADFSNSLRSKDRILQQPTTSTASQNPLMAFTSSAPIGQTQSGLEEKNDEAPGPILRPRSRQRLLVSSTESLEKLEEDAHIIVRGEQIDYPEGMEPKARVPKATGVATDDETPDQLSELNTTLEITGRGEIAGGPSPPWPLSQQWPQSPTRPPSAAKPPSSPTRQDKSSRSPLSPASQPPPALVAGLSSPPSSAASPTRPYSPTRPSPKLDNTGGTGAGRRNRERERDKEEDSLSGHMAAYQLRMTQELQASRLKHSASMEPPKQDKKSIFPLASSEEAINELDLLRPSTYGGFPRSFSTPALHKAAPGAPTSWGWGGVSATALTEKLTNARDTPPTPLTGTRPTVMAAASHMRTQDPNALPRLEGSNILPPPSREATRDLSDFGERASQDSIHINDSLLAGLKDGSKSMIIFSSSGNASGSIDTSRRSPTGKLPGGAKTLPARNSDDFELPLSSKPAIAAFAADDFQRTLRRNENNQARMAPPPKMLMRGKPVPDRSEPLCKR